MTPVTDASSAAAADGIYAHLYISSRDQLMSCVGVATAGSLAGDLRRSNGEHV